jgi:hypothetical protein
MEALILAAMKVILHTISVIDVDQKDLYHSIYCPPGGFVSARFVTKKRIETDSH